MASRSNGTSLPSDPGVAAGCECPNGCPVASEECALDLIQRVLRSVGPYGSVVVWVKRGRVVGVESRVFHRLDPRSGMD
jgi:hypothetical protein